MQSSHVFQRMRWFGLLLALLALQVGCASKGLLVQRTPVPGSNIYCLSGYTDAGFRANLKTYTVMYGARRLGGLGGGAVCDLDRFYLYTVTWQTKDGRSERFEFDFEKIMRKFQDETPQVMNMNRLNGQPDLRVQYFIDRVEVSYVIRQYQIDGMERRNGLEILTKPFITTNFPLLTVPLSPSAEAAVSK